MTWCSNKSTTGRLTRFFALAIAFGWTLLPAICEGALAEPHAGALAALHHHDGSDAHGDSQRDGHDKDATSCCRSLAQAKFLTQASLTFASSKAIPVGILDTESVARTAAQATKPPTAATGPPRTRHTRFLSYTPLAPPTPAA